MTLLEFYQQFYANVERECKAIGCKTLKLNHDSRSIQTGAHNGCNLQVIWADPDVGENGPSRELRLQLVQKILSAVVPVEISEDIIANLYSKLIINSCITSLGAICGLYLGDMLRQKKIRTVFIGIMREAMEVAAAMQMTVPPYANKIDYYKFFGRRPQALCSMAARRD